MTPTRIQRRRTKGFRLPPGTICITRPGRYGNPFVVGETYRAAWLARIANVHGLEWQELIKAGVTPKTKEEAVKWFKMHLETILKIWPESAMKDIEELARAKHIACWCKEGEACHGDVWIEKIRELGL